MQRRISPWIKVVVALIVAVIASAAIEYFRSGGDVRGMGRREGGEGPHGAMDLPPGHPPVSEGSPMGADSSGIRKLEDAAKAHPDDPKAHIELANSYRKAGRFEEAMKQLDRALELDPKDAEAHRYKGALYFYMDPAGGFAQQSRDEYAKAVELKPDYADAYMGLALMDHRLDRMDSARQNYQKAIQFGAKDSMGIGKMLGLTE